MPDPKYANLIEQIRREVVSRNPEQAWVIDNLAFLHVGGSTLYGTNTAASDLDVRGITIAPKSFWVGARHFEQLECSLAGPGVGDVEVVIFDVRKWLRLAVAVNPNVVETLFVEDDSPWALVTTDRWRFIRLEATALLNRQAHAGYHGYTISQLKKMVVKQSNKTGRRQIADEFGFDLKFAAHGFRLARQGAELLRSGRITFPRPDREYLSAIRHGKIYGPGDLDRCVADLQAAAKELDRAYLETVLPAKVDFERYDRLLLSIYDRYVAGIDGPGTPSDARGNGG
jgi:hypothetical protein